MRYRQGQSRERERNSKSGGGRYVGGANRNHGGGSSGHLRSRALSPSFENTRHKEIAVFGPPEPRSHSAHRADVRDKLRGNENVDPLSVAVYPRKHKHNSGLTHHQGEGINHGSGHQGALHEQNGDLVDGHRMARLTQHQSKQASVTRDLRMGRIQGQVQGHSKDSTPVERPHSAGLLHPHQQQHNMGRMTPIDLSNILFPSIQPHVTPEYHHDAVQDQPNDGELSDDNCEPSLRVVVGYIGSIEMPRDANIPSARLQSIRSAVRRLRVENRIHTLVMMDVYIGGIRLTNTMGSTVAHYPGEKVAFSGVCPDDKRFFGIVTLHSVSSDEISSDTSSPPGGDDWAGSSSCHVFMVDPELRGHSAHAHKARSFGIQCTVDPETQVDYKDFSCEYLINS